MKANIQINLKALTNDIHFPLYKNQDRFLMLYGGAGGAKSHFIAQKILARILSGMETGVKHTFLALRKVDRTVKHSVFKLLCNKINDWGISDLVNINKTDKEFLFVKGSSIICTGLDNPVKIKSIESVTSEWLEEFTEFTEDDFTQLDLRLRGEHKAYFQMMLSFNPISKLHWIHEKFFANKFPDCKIVHSNYKHNRFLDAKYRERLESYEDLNPYIHMVYTLGEWGVRSGVIYSAYEKIDEFPNNFDDEIYGLDFGFNNPCALVYIEFKDGVPFIREKIYERGLTVDDLIKRLEMEIPDKAISIYADSEAPDKIEAISRAGFNIYPAYKGRGSVMDGINYCIGQELKISSDSINVIKEIDGYMWKRDKNNVKLEEPAKFNDHLMDAIRYALYTHHMMYAKEPSYAVV